jgi:hypothetical protein
MMKARELKLPFESGLIEFEKIKEKLKLVKEFKTKNKLFLIFCS